MTNRLYQRRKHSTSRRGVTVLLVLAFMGIFIIIIGTVTSYTFVQLRYGRALLAQEQAFHVAEAGLEYYRWFLAHFPNNLTNGTGGAGPYTYTVEDPEGGVVGEADISITGTTACGVVQSIEIRSEGESAADSLYKRTVLGRYMRPSVAEYSHIVNADVWAGADRTIVGPYHSNGGVRMDGTNNSDVTSAVSTWVCNSGFGCSPTDNDAPGVFGSGPGSALWQYPVPQIDFPSLFSTLGTSMGLLRSYAHTGGILLTATSTRVGGVHQSGPYASVGGSEQQGYRIVFRSDGFVDVYRVTGVTSIRAFHASIHPTDYHNSYEIINAQTFVGTYQPPGNCALIYSEAKTWIEGTVSGKVTIVAADQGAFTPDIILNNNVTYGTFDGTSGLTAIAERSVIIPLVSPDVMTLRGIFVAQSGFFGRKLYRASGGEAVPGAYTSYVMQSTLTTTGSVISNLRVGTKWTCGGSYCSGYNTRVDNYDRSLAASPPPFTPSASTDFRFVIWREE